MMAKINEIEVDPQPLAIVEGRWLWRTSAAGEIIDGVDRAGLPMQLTYSAGAFVLADADLNILCGPISRGAAHLLALDIVAGSSRTATKPGLSLHLATVLLGMTLEILDPPAAAAALAAPNAKAAADA